MNLERFGYDDEWISAQQFSSWFVYFSLVLWCCIHFNLSHFLFFNLFQWNVVWDISNVL